MARRRRAHAPAVAWIAARASAHSRGLAGTFLLTLCWVVSGANVAAEPIAAGELPKTGRFAAGIGIEPLGVGASEAWTRFGGAGGMNLSMALQFEIGPRWAFRFPLSLDFTVHGGHTGYAALALSPGAVYRWHRRVDQRWIPYVGLAARFASQAIRRDLAGLPLVTATTSALSEHDFDFDGGSPDPNLDVQLSVAPEMSAGLEDHINSWFALNLGFVYVWARIDGEDLHLFRQFIALRLTL